MPNVPVPRRREGRPPETPEDLYDRLTITDPAIGGLWRHQSHVLGRYYADHADSPDVALELPTGAGKTLVGLLIADWCRQVKASVSAFVCPTRQLARQAHEKAKGYGLNTVLLTGRSAAWDPGDRTRGLTAEATIVSVYSHIFNVSPRISAQTLVLDDAHAAEGSVAGNWSLSVDRQHRAYRPLLDAVGASLNEERLGEFCNDELGPHSHPLPELVGPSDLGNHAEALVETLDEFLEDGESASYALSELRGHLSGCLMYVSWKEILIRPFVVPTRFHEAFEAPEQRVYLSATLGQAGELERAFGRTKIARVETPPGWERHGSGRRLVLLPRAGMHPPEATAFIQETIASFTRALVLVPSNWHAGEVRAMLPENWSVLEKGDVDDRLQPFPVSTASALVLANRYDGIDLPGEQCELIVISSLPSGTHLQERFLFDTVEARSALRERIRTRVMQGMGRATRNRNDHAVVIMTGENLIDFLRDPGNLTGLRPELQAELGYGLFLAREGHDLDDVVTSFLARDEDWAEAEEYLREESESADSEPPAGARQLQESARSEVRACEAAWRGEPKEAAAFAQAAVRRLTVEAVGPYRTLWKVLAAHWAAQHATQSEDPVDAKLAAELVRDAAGSARTRAWRPALPTVQVETEAEALDTRAVRLANELQKVATSPRADRLVTELEDWISSAEAASFERGLQRLGRLLGFDAVRPNVRAAPDSAWRDAGQQILWEAKSEQESSGPISARIVRQATTHPTWVKNELDWEAEDDAIVFIVSPREEVDESARSVASDDVLLVGSEAVQDLATETAAMWRTLVAGVRGLTSREAVARVTEEISSRRLEVEQICEHLGARRIADLPTVSR